MAQQDQDMKFEVSLSKNSTFIVKDGIIKEIKAPPTGFGKQIVCWSNGKPTHVEFNYTEPII
ncbi:DUF3954 domain-containing protein [Planococcus kocurii]|uniref:DUF3954 domain-containing protein n=1 Tax=Planococcus kocurii TaxID=1374 RepID=UPI003D0580B2